MEQFQYTMLQIGTSAWGQKHADWHKIVVSPPSGLPSLSSPGLAPTPPPSQMPLSVVYDTQPYLMTIWDLRLPPSLIMGLIISRLPVTFQLRVLPKANARHQLGERGT